MHKLAHILSIEKKSLLTNDSSMKTIVFFMVKMKYFPLVYLLFLHMYCELVYILCVLVIY